MFSYIMYKKIIYFCKCASKPTENMVLKLTGLAEAPLKDSEIIIKVNTSNNVFKQIKAKEIDISNKEALEVALKHESGNNKKVIDIEPKNN